MSATVTGERVMGPGKPTADVHGWVVVLRYVFLAALLAGALPASVSARMYEEPKSSALSDKSLDNVDRRVLKAINLQELLSEDRARAMTPERPGPQRFAVSEDDHIDYLVGDSAGTVPVQLAARLRRSHLLFLGYAVDDWSLRVFLRRVWGGDRLAYRSWAVQPGAEHVASELWHERGAEVYDVSLGTYAGELARLTLALAEEDAART